MVFAIHWHESAMDLHVFPIPIPPPEGHLLWMKASHWCGWWWFILLPLYLFCSMLLHSICFSSLIPICFKSRPSLLYFSRKSHSEIQSRRFFSLMWNPSIKAMNTTKLVQITSNAWFGDLWVCQLSPAWRNTDCSQCLDLIAVNFHWQAWQWSPVQQEISRVKCQSQHLIHTLQKSLILLYCFLLFIVSFCCCCFLLFNH